MANSEPLYNLLRTHSVDRYLVRRARNEFVGHLRNLLNELGYGRDLQWDRLKADYFYGEETVLAVRNFARRNQMNSDGIGVSPPLLIRLLQRFDTIPGLELMQRGLEGNSLSQAFIPTDPLNYGAVQLKLMLQSLGIFEQDVVESLRQYALQQGLYFENGERLTPTLARALMADLLPGYGDDFALRQGSSSPPPNEPPTEPPAEPPVVTPVDPLPNKKLEVVESTRSVSVSDGNIQIAFRKRDEGVYTVGFHPVSTFVDQYDDKLANLDISRSGMAVVDSVAQNEGNLDAINTYDRGFVSLGIFQWTLGRDDRAGELAALLKKVKTNFPHTFRVFFQDFGIDVANDTNTTYGYLTYNGRPINSGYQKDQFREPEWAFRFWRAAQNVDVQSVQVKHALSRLNNFYWKDNFRVLGHKLNEVITSSYGVALLLDNHVNRPSWVSRCVERAMSNTGLTSGMSEWTKAEELRVIDEYLRIRENYSENGYPPMTKARERARKIGIDLRNNVLSDERGSFQVSELALRSYNTLEGGSPDVVLPPPYYAQEDYPDIIMEIDEE